MKKEKKGTWGKFEWIDHFDQRDGSIRARAFFIELLSRLCSQSYDYWKVDKDSPIEKRDYYPLTYPERNIYSSFAAATHRTTPHHMSEESISRRHRSEETKVGRVDFWANHKSIDYLIELKRVPFGFREKKWASRLKKPTTDAFNQAKSLKEEAKDWEDGVVAAGLCICCPYSHSDGLPPDRNADHGGDFRDLMQKIVTSKSQSAPNFAAMWTPPRDARIFWTKHLNRYELIPYIGFVGRLRFFDQA